MPQIETWPRLPPPIREHLLERMRDPNITLGDLNKLRLWIESRPNVPEGTWYKDLARSSYAVRASIRKLFCWQARPQLVSSFPDNRNWRFLNKLTAAL